MKKNIVFGFHAIIEAIRSGKQIDKVLLKSGLQSELFRELMSLIGKNNIPKQFMPIEGLNKITTKNHQGAIAFLSLIEYQKIENIIPGLFEQGKMPFILVLDEITDVRNFGSICRIAECAGVHAIIIPSTGSAQINADTVKSSSGAVYHIPICREKNLTEAISFLKNSGLKVFAATEKTESIYFKADYTLPVALVLGSEFKGVSNQIIQISDELIKIPMFGEIGSLNVSNAASVIIYEVVKQRMITENQHK